MQAHHCFQAHLTYSRLIQSHIIFIHTTQDINISNIDHIFTVDHPLHGTGLSKKLSTTKHKRTYIHTYGLQRLFWDFLNLLTVQAHKKSFPANKIRSIWDLYCTVPLVHVRTEGVLWVLSHFMNFLWRNILSLSLSLSLLQYLSSYGLKRYGQRGYVFKLHGNLCLQLTGIYK